MQVLVTGCAGFIGSTLTEHLLQAGHGVIGVDALTGYYDPAEKLRNLERCRDHRAFAFLARNLTGLDESNLAGVEVIFHLAGQPGVRGSWGDQFGQYVQNNVVATQRLLESARNVPGLRRFVYASSSAVYGNTGGEAVTELSPTLPYSPYGVTKLAAEHLCSLYSNNFGLPAVCLRLFTVFGPRQRPDMLIRRLIAAALDGSSFVQFGDGSHRRHFTYVADVVQAMMAAASADSARGVYNIAGSSAASVAEVIAAVEAIAGVRIRIDRADACPGDVKDTHADIGRAVRDLGYRPAYDLLHGLAAEVEDLRTGMARRDLTRAIGAGNQS